MGIRPPPNLFLKAEQIQFSQSFFSSQASQPCDCLCVLLWTLSSLSTSVLCTGDKTEHSTPGVAWQAPCGVGEGTSSLLVKPLLEPPRICSLSVLQEHTGHSHGAESTRSPRPRPKELLPSWELPACAALLDFAFPGAKCYTCPP